MSSRIKHIPSGEIYENRKEAKMKMGHANYNRANSRREFVFLDPRD